MPTPSQPAPFLPTPESQAVWFGIYLETIVTDGHSGTFVIPDGTDVLVANAIRARQGLPTGTNRWPGSPEDLKRWTALRQTCGGRDPMAVWEALGPGTISPKLRPFVLAGIMAVIADSSTRRGNTSPTVRMTTQRAMPNLIRQWWGESTSLRRAPKIDLMALKKLGASAKPSRDVEFSSDASLEAAATLMRNALKVAPEAADLLKRKSDGFLDVAAQSRRPQSDGPQAPEAKNIGAGRPLQGGRLASTLPEQARYQALADWLDPYVGSAGGRETLVALVEAMAKQPDHPTQRRAPGMSPHQILRAAWDAHPAVCKGDPSQPITPEVVHGTITSKALSQLAGENLIVDATVDGGTGKRLSIAAERVVKEILGLPQSHHPPEEEEAETVAFNMVARLDATLRPKGRALALVDSDDPYAPVPLAPSEHPLVISTSKPHERLLVEALEALPEAYGAPFEILMLDPSHRHKGKKTQWPHFDRREELGIPRHMTNIPDAILYNETHGLFLTEAYRGSNPFSADRLTQMNNDWLGAWIQVNPKIPVTTITVCETEEVLEDLKKEGKVDGSTLATSLEHIRTPGCVTAFPPVRRGGPSVSAMAIEKSRQRAIRAQDAEETSTAHRLLKVMSEGTEPLQDDVKSLRDNVKPQQNGAEPRQNGLEPKQGNPRSRQTSAIPRHRGTPGSSPEENTHGGGRAHRKDPRLPSNTMGSQEEAGEEAYEGTGEGANEGTNERAGRILSLQGARPRRMAS